MTRKSKTRKINALLVMCVAFLCGSFIVSAENGNSAKEAVAEESATEKVFEMDGAAIRLSDPTGLRFAAVVDPETVAEVEQDDNKTFGGLIVPYSYFDTYGVSKSGDYLSDFLAQNLGLAYKEDLEVTKKADEDGNYSVDYSIVNIRNYNLNRDFFGVLYIKTVDGDTVTYEYAAADTPSLESKTVRSVAYVASAAYNEEEKYSDSQLTIIEKFILKSAYMESQDNGNISDDEVNSAVANMTMDTYFNDITIDGESEVALDLSTRSYEVSLTNLDLYSNPNILYSTSDKEVATVDEDGVVTPWSAGTATISTKILGQTLTYQVTVNDDLDFVENGESTYRIVLPTNYTEVEKIAADELNYFMEEATGATFNIVYDDEVTYTENGRYIYIGAVKQLQTAGITLLSSLGTQGYKVQQKDKSIFIAGYDAKGNGAAYGVYSLLEDLVGFNYFAYDEMTLEAKTNIVLSDYEISKEQAPAIQNATTQSIYAADTTAGLRLGFVALKDIFYLGGVTPYHNSFIYLNKDTYQAEHSDWYSEDGNQICYTAHGDSTEYNAMVDAAYSGMKNTYEKAKEAGYGTVNLSFTMEDNESVCSCTSCALAKVMYSTDAGAVVKFCNELSDKFAEDDITDVNIYFFAYFGFEEAPSITCNDNVGPIYCPIYASNFSSVDPDAESYSSANSYVSERIGEWKAISNHVSVWEYSAYWANFMLPSQIFRAMEDDYNYYADLELDYFFDQGKSDSNGLYGTYFAAYAYWKKAKLVWGEEHTAEEFFNQYYRDAASDMLDLYNATTEFLTSFYVEGKENYPLETLNTWKRYISAAESSIASYSESDGTLYTKLYNRIGAESAFVDYLLLKYYGDTFTKSEYESLLDRFYAECENGGITQWKLNGNDVHTALTNTVNATIADVISIITTIDESEDLVQTLQKLSAARKMYDSLTEEEQGQVTNYANLTSFEEEYDAYLCIIDYTEFNGTQPFAKHSSWLAEYVLGLYNDADYGIVMSADVYNTRNEHFAIRYTSPTIDETEYELVQFYVYNGGAKDTYLFYSMESGLVEKYALLKAGQWNLITVPAQDFETGKAFGVLRCEAVQYKFSAMFAKSNSSMVEEVETLIAALDSMDIATSEAGYAILAARNAYDNLSAELQERVSNYETLTTAEINYKTAVQENALTDDAIQNFNEQAQAFNAAFVTITPATLKTTLTEVAAVESAYESLTYFQQCGVDEEIYATYLANKNSFFVIDGMTSGAGSNFAKLYGTNGFVNLTSWQDISAAALTEAANAYGGAATIGANAQADIVFHYTARADLDLSGYTHVTFAVRNGKSTPMSVYLYNTVGTWSKLDCLASGIATATSNTDFTTIVMTVEQFQNYYIDFYYETTASGNIWITPIIAYNDISAERVEEMIDSLPEEITLEDKEIIQAAQSAYEALTDASKANVHNLEVLNNAIAAYEEAENAYNATLVAEVESLISAIPTTVDEESLEAILAARNAYDNLSASLQESVSNYEALTTAEAEIKALAQEDDTAIEFNQSLATFNEAFEGVTPETLKTVNASISTMETSYESLTDFQKLGVDEEIYATYLANKNSFFVVDDMTGAVASRIVKWQSAGSFNNISNSAAVLTHATYGQCASIGTNADANCLVDFTKNMSTETKAELAKYDYVTFMVRNGISGVSDLSLYVATVSPWSATSELIISGIPYASTYTASDFTQVTMTVEQFLAGGINFYKSAAKSGNIWITPMIAVQATQETQNVIALIAALDGTEDKIVAARTAYDALSDTEKVYVSNYATLVAAEEVLASSDEDVQALIAQITAFNTKFAATSPEYYNVLSADITAIDEAYAALSTSLQSGVENYDAYLANKNSFCVIEDMSTGLADRIAIGGGAFSAKTPYNGNSTLTTYAAIYGGVGSFGLTQNAVVWRWSNRDTLDLSGYTYVTFTIRHNLANGLKIRLLDKSSWSETKVLQENIASSTASTSTPFTVITMTVEEYLSSLISFVQPTTASGNIWMSSFIAYN